MLGAKDEEAEEEEEEEESMLESAGTAAVPGALPTNARDV